MDMGGGGGEGAHCQPQVYQTYQLLLLSRVIDVKYGRSTFFFYLFTTFSRFIAKTAV